ncbi:uncharacterized protein LOC135181616 [Pogoniulus pusillus]|uniref:uncharacterized protein LOC135181616 n=1 Tax=Pogoniulus pusillus TaxID=488313 RepID=UPI0030B98B03
MQTTTLSSSAIHRFANNVQLGTKIIPAQQPTLGLSLRASPPEAYPREPAGYGLILTGGAYSDFKGRLPRWRGPAAATPAQDKGPLFTPSTLTHGRRKGSPNSRRAALQGHTPGRRSASCPLPRRAAISGDPAGHHPPPPPAAAGHPGTCSPRPPPRPVTYFAPDYGSRRSPQPAWPGASLAGVGHKIFHGTCALLAGPPAPALPTAGNTPRGPALGTAGQPPPSSLPLPLDKDGEARLHPTAGSPLTHGCGTAPRRPQGLCRPPSPLPVPVHTVGDAASQTKSPQEPFDGGGTTGGLLCLSTPLRLRLQRKASPAAAEARDSQAA